MDIVVANYKGGVGKTTTTVWSAQILAAHGHKVRVVDADRQGSLTTWHEQAAADGYPLGFDLERVEGRGSNAVREAVQRASRTVLDDSLKAGLKSTGHVFVDMSPGNRNDFFAAVEAAQAVIVPIRPQFADWQQAIRIRDDLAKNAPDVPSFVLVTAARSGTSGTKEIGRWIYSEVARGPNGEDVPVPEGDRERLRYGLRPMIPLREGDTNYCFGRCPPLPGTALWIAYLDALMDLDALLRRRDQPAPVGATP